MPASRGTIKDMANILVEELGREAAQKLIVRLLRDTHGNNSYLLTIRRLAEELGGAAKDAKAGWMDPRS